MLLRKFSQLAGWVNSVLYTNMFHLVFYLVEELRRNRFFRMEYGQLNQKLQAELVVTIANEANFEHCNCRTGIEIHRRRKITWRKDKSDTW